jgi:hypothetical protein
LACATPKKPTSSTPRSAAVGGTHAFLDWLTSQRLSYWVGFGLPDNTADLLALIPEQVWTPAYDAHDQIRDGAWVAELTGLLNLDGWPAGASAANVDSSGHGGVAGHKAEQAWFGPQHREVGQAVLADGQRHRQIGDDLDRVMLRGRLPPARVRAQPTPVPIIPAAPWSWEFQAEAAS